MSDLATLFATDPLGLSDQDLNTIISKYREARKNFNLGEKSAGATKKVAAKQPKITDLDLGELGLD